MGMVQSMVAAALDIVPPLIPPPIWNNMPLPCAPMITGHNCFGAVLYPITMADFTIADVTDAMLDGYIAGFPNTYAEKVGKRVMQCTKLVSRRICPCTVLPCSHDARCLNHEASPCLQEAVC